MGKQNKLSKHRRFEPTSTGITRALKGDEQSRALQFQKLAMEEYPYSEVDAENSKQMTLVELVLIMVRKKALNGHVGAGEYIDRLSEKYGPKSLIHQGAHLLVPETLSAEEYKEHLADFRASSKFLIAEWEKQTLIELGLPSPTNKTTGH